MSTGANEFDLGKFRYAAAAMIKYLIRARERFEPGFLGDRRIYQQWYLDNISADDEDLIYLLQAAQQEKGKVWDQMLAIGGSGGVGGGDPLGEFKLAIKDFVEVSSLDTAVALIRQNQPVDWQSLANWADLPEIRRVLDSLPHPDNPRRHDEAGGSDTGPCPPRKFLFNGQPYDVPGKRLYRFIAHLWFAEDRTAEIEDFEGPVWEDGVTPGKVGSLRTRSNKFFETQGMPFRVGITGEYVRLIDPTS